MNKGFAEVDHTITLNYEEYAKMGISSVYVNDWASKKLYKEQAATVAKAVDERSVNYCRANRQKIAKKELTG